MSTIYDMYAYSASGTSSTAATGSSTSSSTGSTNDVGESFMALLLAELKYQNPLEPMDTNQMVSQMVQLNSLTQLQNISTAIEKTNESNLFQSGTGLIGKTVGYYDGDENLQSGVVEAFEMDGDSLLLTIGDTVIDFDSVAFVTQTSETENE